MRPTLSRLAIALAATFALAPLASQAQQSNVRLYGLVDMSLASTKAPGASSITGVESGKMTTSFWGMSGSEDLGNGLTANFRFEGFFRGDIGAQGRFNGDPLFSRAANVGLSSKSLGTISLGRNSTQLFLATISFNAFGDSFGHSPSVLHYYAAPRNVLTGDSGWSDSIVYTSPTFSGLTLGAAITTSENVASQAASTGRNKSLAARYSQGPLAASLVWQDVRKNGSTSTATASVDDVETVQVGLAYDFGVARVFFQYGDVDNASSGISNDIIGLGVRVPLGAGALIAQYGENDASRGADRDTFSVGYLHNLSKRTELYAVGTHDSVDGLSNGRYVSLGIRHRF